MDKSIEFWMLMGSVSATLTGIAFLTFTFCYDNILKTVKKASLLPIEELNKDNLYLSMISSTTLLLLPLLMSIIILLNNPYSTYILYIVYISIAFFSVRLLRNNNIKSALTKKIIILTLILIFFIYVQNNLMDFIANNQTVKSFFAYVITAKFINEMIAACSLIIGILASVFTVVYFEKVCILVKCSTNFYKQCDKENNDIRSKMMLLKKLHDSTANLIETSAVISKLDSGIYTDRLKLLLQRNICRQQ